MNRLIEKLGSGRFIFTVISAFVFLIGSFRELIPSDKVVEIIMLIIIFYFNRTDRKTNGEEKKQ